MAFAHIVVSQQAEEQAFIVRDIDGVAIITKMTSSLAGIGGAVFGVAGAIVGAVVGLATGIFFAIFGDQKKGAMNMYRTLMAEIMAQVDPGSVQFNGEHDAVTLTRPASPEIMLDITRQMLQAFVDTFEPGSDDHSDALLALNSVHIAEFKPCCNRTIVSFEVLNADNILSRIPGGVGAAILGAVLWLSRR